MSEAAAACDAEKSGNSAVERILHRAAAVAG